ncbi:MAG: Rrf2 family transcriptional regulator [Saprospiraceae bacterium]|nr:Rrf2 family transcriptional regulator [Lewinella sp.]
MKISAQDEYGLRILLRIARSEPEEGLSIAQLSELEGLSNAYIAKLTRTLRLAGFISSTRGQKGGYVLAKPMDEIVIKDVLDALGGALFQEDFCQDYTGGLKLCTNSVDCSVRSLWQMVQMAVDRVLEKVTLEDLIGKEKDSISALRKLLDEHAIV